MTDKFVITFIYLIFYGIRAHTNLTNTNFNDILTLFTPNDKTPIFYSSNHQHLMNSYTELLGRN